MEKVHCLRRLLPLAGVTLLVALCLALPACTDTGAPSDTEAETSVTAADTTVPIAPDTEPLTEPDTAPETLPETTAPETEETTADLSLIVDPVYFPAEQAGAQTDVVLRVADFGAVGDGVTDDGPAFCAAVNEAITRQATLELEAGKTYYIGTSSNVSGYFKTPFVFTKADGVTVEGNGATVKVAPGINYWVMWESRNIRIRNVTFDYAVSVYLVGTVIAVNGTEVTYATDMEPYVESYDYTGITAFSIEYNEGIQNRPHTFLSKMERTGDKQVTVTYTGDHSYAEGDLVFLPNPGVGHVYSEVIYMGHNSGAMVFENVTIRQAPSFIAALKGNSAEFYFENVDFWPDETDGRAIHMVSWRDGYHCKDNRYPMHWNECDVGVLFDDVFNLSGTMSNVTAVGSDTVITCTVTEFNFAVGDVIDVYCQTTGTWCGTATIVEITSSGSGQTLTLDTPLEAVEVGYTVANRNICCPGSTIRNSRFTGTYRFRRDLRVENCTFELLHMWIIEDGGVEGPLPGKLDFINCTFLGTGTVELGAYNSSSGRQFHDVAKQITEVGFWGCSMDTVKKVFRRGVDVTTSDTFTLDDLFTNESSKEIVP